jgi:hypothetical protein
VHGNKPCANNANNKHKGGGVADDRFFIKVHDGFPEHPKTIGLSDKAFRAVVEFWCYSHRQETDGKIPLALFNRLPPKVRKELLVDYAIMHETHVEMHDYLEHQQSAKEIAELRKARSEAGRLGGKAKANRLASAKANAKQNGSKVVADIDIDKDLATNVAKSKDAQARPRPDEFIDWYLEYPRKTGRAAAERAYAKARERVSAETLLAGVRAYASDPNRVPEFTKHPATWLNGGCWDDDPLPARGGSQPDHGQRALAKGRELLQSWETQQQPHEPILELEA